MNTNQILYFDTKTGIFKKTVFNIVGIKDGEFCCLKLSDGRKIMVNRKNLLMIELIPDSMAKDTWGELSGTYSTNVEEWHSPEKKRR
jgi:hypothetical protein